MQFHTDPNREDDPHALPDAETFDLQAPPGKASLNPDDPHSHYPNGWYWQACFPGCLPDGDAIGPFDTEALAIADAQSN